MILILLALSFSPDVRHVAERFFGPSAPLFLCILTVESGGRHHITGDGGRAYGIGQLHEDALMDACKHLGRSSCNPKALARRVLHDKREGTVLSAAYLSLMVETFGGDWTWGIMAYQSGPGAVQRGQYNWGYYGRVISCVRSSGH